MLNKSNFNRFILRNCFLLGTVCAGLLNSNICLAADIDYSYSNTSTPFGLMDAYSRGKYNKYTLSTTSTGAENERSIVLDGITYYFIPNELNEDMIKGLDYWLMTTPSKTNSDASVYNFDTGSSRYRIKAIMGLGVKITETTTMDYTYRVVQEDGSYKYYKVTSNGYYSPSSRNSAATSISTEIFGGKKYTGSGGAAAVKEGITVPNITTSFVGNEATQNGGALYNPSSSSIDYILSQFISNKANNGGGFANEGNTNLIISDFYANRAETAGGAIYNIGDISSIIGHFNDNSAAYTGGAIANESTISSIAGKFNNNAVDNSGGSISNMGAISSISADFNYNTANKGGAIWNVGTIQALNGDFYGNNVTSLGGAILNGSSDDGTKVGNIVAITGNFKNNHADQYGGAIANGTTLGLLAKDQNIVFYNNTDSTGYNDLFGNETGTFNLNAQSGYGINFGGSVRQVTTLNINNHTDSANRGGDYVFNNTVDAGVNLYNGANVKLANIKQTDGSTSYGVINTTKAMTVDSVAGSNIDMRNDHIDTNTVGGLALGSNLGLGIDTNLRRYSNSTSDKLVSTATATGDGKMVINSINLTNSTYGEGDSMKVSIADDNTKGKIKIADDILDNITGATNYYTKVEYDENTGDLVFTDKLVNKSTLDQALQDAGVSDMSIYAKTADVYGKSEVYTKDEADGKFLTTHQDISGKANVGDSYTKSESDAKYATQTAISDMLTKTEANSTYATKDSISDMLTKTEAGTTYATKNELDSYAKSSDVADTYATKEALTTGLEGKVDTSAFNEYKTEVGNTYATKESLNDYARTSDLSDYAKSSDISDMLTKTEAGNTYATKNELGSYAKSSDVADTYATKASLNDYAKTSDISDMLTKTEAGNTYATKDSLNGYAKSDDVYSKNDIDTKLGGYVTSDNLDIKLGSYVKSDDLTTTLGNYAKTEDLNAYAKTADIESTYATKASLNEYVKSNDLDSKLSEYAKSDDVYSKNDIDTKLGGYVTSDNLDTKLGSYVKSDDLTTTLASYAKTEDIANTYATKTELDGKVDTSAFNTYKTEVGNTYATKDELGNKADASTVTALQTTVSNLSDTVSGKANQSDLEALQTTVAGKANAADVYTKDEADGKYATQNAISDMLTKTEAGNTYATQSALNDYKTSNDNAVSALTGKMTQAETDISDIKGSAVMSSGITAEKVAAYEGYAALIDAKQDALSTEQMAVLNSGITAADIATVQTANTRLDAMDTTVADLSADFGDVADFSNSKTGNLKNDVPSSSKPNASTVTKAIANMDATIGQIHGLAAKVGVENGGANLGQNTTVEEHLTSLAGSIGNRTHYTQQNYIKNNQTVAQSLDNLDIAVGSIKRDFTSAQIANEARFNDIEHNINHLENKMEKGLAANNALAALKPLSSTYQTQLSAAMGGYENNQAFAIGGFHYVTEKVLLNTGVAYGGNNSMSYNVGVTFGF